MNIFDAFLKEIRATPNKENGDYENAETGLLHCGICKMPKEARISNGVIKPDLCDCGKKANEKHEKEKQLKLNEERRDICFAEANRKKHTFANDNKLNEKLSTGLIKYVNGFDSIHKPHGTGVTLYGACGSGKTYYMCATLNALIDKGYKAFCTKMRVLVEKRLKEKDGFYSWLKSFAVIGIDDFGMEEKTEKTIETMHEIIDFLVEQNIPVIYTSNLSYETFNSKNTSLMPVYQRIMAKSPLVKVEGTNQRNRACNKALEEIKLIFQ